MASPRRRTLRLRTLLAAIAALAVVLAIGIRWYRSIPVPFPRLVGGAVPARATLADLESIAGPAEHLPATDPVARLLTKQVIADAKGHPDGWQAGDTWAVYYREGNIWGFQLRNGRIVNYDPDRFAQQRAQEIDALGG